MPSITIREAPPEEHGDLLSLVMAAYGEFGEFLSEDFIESFKEDVAGLMADEHTEVLLGEVNGAPAGTITFYPDGRFYNEEVPSDWACLRTLAVLPSARGKGVGRALMNESLRRARKLGRTRVLLHTMGFMTAAIALHESLGFRRAPDLDVEYSPDVTVVAYLLDL